MKTSVEIEEPPDVREMIEAVRANFLPRRKPVRLHGRPQGIVVAAVLFPDVLVTDLVAVSVDKQLDELAHRVDVAVAGGVNQVAVVLRLLLGQTGRRAFRIEHVAPAPSQVPSDMLSEATTGRGDPVRRRDGVFLGVEILDRKRVLFRYTRTPESFWRHARIRIHGNLTRLSTAGALSWQT